MKTELSKEDYLKLVGLFALAHHHNKALWEINIAAAEIIEMESDGDFGDGYYGHLSDALCDVDSTSPDGTLRKLKITVKKKDLKPNSVSQ